jgi:uncharacterized membrane protein YraQ (UPF0718 family)
MVAATLALNWARAGRMHATVLCCPGGKHYYELQGYLVKQKGDNIGLRDHLGRIHQVPVANVVQLRRHWFGTVDSATFLRWAIAAMAVAAVAVTMVGWFSRAQLREWWSSSIDLAARILPLLLAGVFVTGIAFGLYGHGGIIPAAWIARAVGGESIGANVVASVAGAAMYFATLTEVPIVGGLVSAGMGDGPALAMLLAGPAVSLPALLVVRNVIGNARTAVYISLVVATAILAGVLHGMLLIG